MLLTPFSVVIGYLSNDLSYSELGAISTDVICCVWQIIPVISHQISMQLSGSLLMNGKQIRKHDTSLSAALNRLPDELSHNFVGQ